VESVFLLLFKLNFRNLDILVTVKDSQGRTFDSIETLQVDWTLSDSGLASLAQPKGTLSQVPVTVFENLHCYGIRSGLFRACSVLDLNL
jgi:hypothetical protein